MKSWHPKYATQNMQCCIFNRVDSMKVGEIVHEKHLT